MFSKTITTLSLLTAFVAAQSSSSPTTTVSLFLPDTDNTESLVASVVSVAPSTTVYEITCPSDVSSDDCGYYPAETVTAGPSMAAGSYSYSGELASWSCNLSGPEGSATSGDCIATVSVGSMGASDLGLTLTALSGSDYAAATSALGEASAVSTSESIALAQSDITYFPVVVTAGQEKLAAATSSGSASGSSQTGSATASGMTTSASAGGSAKSSGE